MRYNNRTLSSALAVVMLVGLTACGGDDESTSTTTPAQEPTETTVLATSAPAAAGVTIAGFGFNTGDGVTAGVEFTVTNDDPASHTLTEVGGAFSVGVSGGEVGTLTIDTPGTYQVICEIHSSMSGTLVVN
jgi:plastocyanin